MSLCLMNDPTLSRSAERPQPLAAGRDARVRVGPKHDRGSKATLKVGTALTQARYRPLPSPPTGRPHMESHVEHDLCYLSATEPLDLFRSGDLPPAEVLRATLT